MSQIVTGMFDGKCPICELRHRDNNPCHREALMARVSRLMHQNSKIRELQVANKEALAMIQEFQKVISGVEQSHEILMEVFNNSGELGAQLKNEYFERLDRWLAGKGTIVPGTSEAVAEQPSNPGRSTSGATVTKLFTTPTNGKDSPNGS